MRGVIAAMGSAALLLFAACNDMTSQPKQTAYSPQPGPAAVPADTVEYGVQPASAPPVTLELLQRGQERYRIFCAPCHSEVGDGRGMIVERGFPAPPSFDLDRLRAASPQYLYDVITQGRGVMYSFADRIGPQDRWAIVAYIRALERSQHAALANTAADARRMLQ
jgi:mono/diheme cytochrome c family protein